MLTLAVLAALVLGWCTGGRLARFVEMTVSERGMEVSRS